ncbi:unnamed protein product [Cylindrotheca closterium]|uniref:Nudix hydrolase domain-containing protein n=1 Tax=Cylindrotheca closterium TaxID=2856 RepID=A0AAD2GCX8_9STRA|nr:unnamed protein product [Cylindrotheca closterium]
MKISISCNSIAFTVCMMASSGFPNRLPNSRLGQKHETYESFASAIGHQSTKPKEFAFIVVTEESDEAEKRGRLLLGRKNRGFGKGMYTCLGGKFDVKLDSSLEASACRELKEEAKIGGVSIDEMKGSKVGIQRFTFAPDEDNESTGTDEKKNESQSQLEMVVHVYWLAFQHCDERLNSVEGCEEITPQWFDDWSLLPLDQMFADDSLWMTTLLAYHENGPSDAAAVQINGWYHYEEKCEETNTIQHYYMDVLPKRNQNGAVQIDRTLPKQSQVYKKQENGKDAAPPTYNLEQQLFHALHDNRIHSPTIKEFRESLAFCKAVKNHFQKFEKKKLKTSGITTAGWKVVLDVAGGHGALAALFLVSNPSIQRAVCIDPAKVGNNGVTKAWGHLWSSDQGDSYANQKKELVYRNECLTTGLPSEIQKGLSMTESPEQILVVACHACQHLSEQILEISCRYGVSVAVVPCCQKDSSPGGPWKATSKALEIPLQIMMDVLLAGRIMGKGTHEVRMKCMNKQITPQNRIIVARALPTEEQDESLLALQAHRSRAQAKLDIAYRRAHVLSSGYRDTNGILSSLLSPSFLHPLGYMTAGVAIGMGASHWMSKR